MKTTQEEFRKWLLQKENTDLEFKKAENNFDYEHQLSDYCSAIANENGGKLILGIIDKTHEVVGTNAFLENWNTLSHKLFQKLNMKVEVEEFFYKDKERILIFHIPRHFPGQPIMSNKVYWMRAGESLVPMDKQTLQKIFAEIEPDFSAQIIENFGIEDIDEIAFENFKAQRIEKTKNERIKTESTEKILSDVGLMYGGKCTFACLVLLGKEEKIMELSPQSEIIYEWRGAEGQTHHDFRISWKKPYFAIYNEIWETINARNIRTPFQEGFIQREIFAFDEKVCREAINNAIAHRDYSIVSGSIFIHTSPQKISVTSPGGFLPGITPENIFEKSQWRNRTIADAMEHTKLVERSGQGIDDIFEISIRQGKGKPNFQGTDAYSVNINIPAVVQDAEFVQFLEKIYNEKQELFSFDELLELENLREKKLIKDLKFKDKFLRLGIVEKIGKTSGIKYMLSRRYYEYDGSIGTYSGIRGLSRQSKKELILQHLERSGKAHVQEFIEAFPDLKRADINNLVQELKNDELIYFDGKIRSKTGVWKLVRKIQN